MTGVIVEQAMRVLWAAVAAVALYMIADETLMVPNGVLWRASLACAGVLSLVLGVIAIIDAKRRSRDV